MKKYMGECRFLFFTIAVMTKMFSSKEMMPRIRKTWGENNTSLTEKNGRVVWSEWSRVQSSNVCPPQNAHRIEVFIKRMMIIIVKICLHYSAPHMRRIPLQRCGAARMLQVWKCWSCLEAVGVTGCSFGDRSKPRWSYPESPPLGRSTHWMRS